MTNVTVDARYLAPIIELAEICTKKMKGEKMGLRPNAELSQEYHQLAALLDGGWEGTYGKLAFIIGIHRRAAGVTVGQLVKSYARRHPEWNHRKVFRQDTGLPGNDPEAPGNLVPA